MSSPEKAPIEGNVIYASNLDLPRFQVGERRPETIHTGDTQDEVPAQIQPNLWLRNPQGRGEQALRHTTACSFVAS